MAFLSSWHGSVRTDFQTISQQRAPLATGREAIKVHKLIDALLASSEQKKAVNVPV